MNISILTQNLEFSRCVLIARVCKKALKSGAHELQDGFENCSKIDEKSAQTGLEIRLFSAWLLASLLARFLTRFWVNFRDQNRTKIVLKSILRGPRGTCAPKVALEKHQRAKKVAWINVRHPLGRENGPIWADLRSRLGTPKPKFSSTSKRDRWLNRYIDR